MLRALINSSLVRIRGGPSLRAAIGRSSTSGMASTECQDANAESRGAVAGGYEHNREVIQENAVFATRAPFGICRFRHHVLVLGNSRGFALDRS